MAAFVQRLTQRGRALAGRLWRALGFGPRFRRKRSVLAQRYIRGSGIEIGALNEPLTLPPGSSVRYVDCLDLPALRTLYPRIAGEPLAPVDVIDDGERLERFADASVDFVVANHFIEHTEDPIGAIEAHLRVLRPGGILFMAVPDKRRSPDWARSETSLEHLLRDHRDGPEWSRRSHFEEWAGQVIWAADPEREADRLEEAGYSIHFHVWTRERFGELLDYLRETLGFPFRLSELEPNRHEFVAVLQKTGAGAPAVKRAE